MSIRRQCYEWRNVSESNNLVITPPLGAIYDYDNVILNRYPVSAVNYKLGSASEKIFWCIVPVPARAVVDIFNGDIGNNLDIPGQLKAYQFVVFDGIAVYPNTFNAQIIVNTTRYFQDPDGVPSRMGGISGDVVPFPNGFPAPVNSTVAMGGVGGTLNFLEGGLKPPVIIKPGDRWAVEVTNNSDSRFPNLSDLQLKVGTDISVARCYIKYLLIDGADCIVAQRLIDAGWPLTVENIWKFKQDILKSHIYAGLAPLPEEVSSAKRKV